MKNILLLTILFLHAIGFEVVIDKTEKLNIKIDNGLTRDKYNDIVLDTVEGLTWQDNSCVTKKKFDYNRAIDYCEKLELGGYDDWKLPTIYQLETIADYNKYDPAIKDGFEFTASKFYWSSTPYKEKILSEDGTPLVQRSYKDRRYDDNGELNAWTVNFMYGASYHQIRKSSKRYVRCVRESK